jgi:pilus assembly protein Flp/PilA
MSLRKRAFRAKRRRIDGGGALAVAPVFTLLLRRIFANRVTVPFDRSPRFTGARGTRALEHDLLHEGRLKLGKDQVVRTLLWNFLANEQGAAAIEYGLLAAGIAVAIIAVVAALGTNLNTTFSTVSTSLK